MKLLSFAASNSRNSINRALVTYATTRLSTDILPDVEVDTIDLNDFEMPIYSIDRENQDGIPDLAHAFLARISAADAVLVSFAEHNGSTTAAWKNIFDWLSRVEMKVFQNKPMVILAASPGGRAGAGVLGQHAGMLPHFGGNIVGQVGIGKWYDVWDAEAQALILEDDINAVDSALSALKSETLEAL